MKNSGVLFRECETCDIRLLACHFAMAIIITLEATALRMGKQKATAALPLLRTLRETSIYYNYTKELHGESDAGISQRVDDL